MSWFINWTAACDTGISKISIARSTSAGDADAGVSRKRRIRKLWRSRGRFRPAARHPDGFRNRARKRLLAVA